MAAAIATMTSPTIGGETAAQALAWTMNQEDSGGYGVAISASVTAGTTATSAAISIGLLVLQTYNNNTTVDDGVSTILLLQLTIR